MQDTRYPLISTSSALSRIPHKTVVVVVGPTAVGKTAAAIALARHFGTAVISADSRQCFRELRIGVARPSDEELAAVPHYFVASHSLAETITAATFEQYALEKAGQVFQSRDVVILAGGTGLYVKAFCEGLDEVPEIPPGMRLDIESRYQSAGIAWLKSELEKADPLFAREGEMQNPQRMMRALEVALATGRSIRSYHSGQKRPRPFRIIKIGLTLPKEQLLKRIDERVDDMIRQGLVEEVKALLPHRHTNALQTVGYREIIGYLDGAGTLAAAIGQIKIHTRQYAKRQLTWFRRDPEINWYPPAPSGDIIRAVEEKRKED